MRSSSTRPKLPDHLCRLQPRLRLPPPIPKVGARVRFTGQWLASVGLHAGSAGLDVFQVVACACGPCRAGDWVATDEAIDGRQRHVAVVNVVEVGRLDTRNCP